jgi:hypothetical protein
MALDTNIAPYFNDFDEFKNFHQILFRPSFSVQARELTQLQSILRDQIAKFGGHIFKHGSVVIPGNTLSDLQTQYIKLEDTFASVAIDVSTFDGLTVIGETTGVKAVVRAVVAKDSTDPNTLYLSYISGGGANGEYSTFAAGEELYVETSPTTRAQVVATTPSGMGSLAFVKAGTYFINGNFVNVDDQKVIISKYTSTPSCRVLLKISESIVTSNTDSTLLDPASGSYNFSAPGADRLKISLTLTTLPLVDDVTDDYIELMRYNAGVLEMHSRYPKYSELEKSIARRTYDESGDYLVNGFETRIREHKKTLYNNGFDEAGDAGKYVIETLPGKGYINGIEVESIYEQRLEVDKARTSAHVKQNTFSINAFYGRYIYVSGLISQPNYKQRTKVDLYNISASTGGTKIGTLRAVAIDYVAGDPGTTNAVYKLYIDELSLNVGYKIENVGGFRFTGSSTGYGKVVHKLSIPSATLDFTIGEILSSPTATRVATVAYYNRSQGIVFAYKHDATKQIPIKGDTVTGSSGSTPTGSVTSVESVVSRNAPAVFPLPKSYVKSIANVTTYDITYTVWKTLVLTTDASGNALQTITDGVFTTPEVGTTVAIGPSGVVTNDKLSIQTETTFRITGGPLSSTVIVLTQVTKDASTNPATQPKIKTLTTVTLNNVVPAKTISLGKADIFKIVSIHSNGVEVTDSYSLDNGQTDFYYGIGKIKLTRTLPTSNLTIVFEYFEHSGSGDFFSVDSYKTLGIEDDLYVSRVPTYVSSSSSSEFYLANCLDFRPTIGTTGEFTSGGASLIDTLVVDEIVDTTVKYYVPRIDATYLDQDGSIKIAIGIPDEVPQLPKLPSNVAPIARFFVNAYTVNIDDIMMRAIGTFRYRMQDIKKLEGRVKNLEFVTQLNSLETSVVSYNVIDAETGIDRFKSGYLVDNFQQYDSVCNYYLNENRCTFFDHKLSAPVEDFQGNITLMSSSSNYLNVYNYLMLPYTESKFISQNKSSRVTNLNPYMVFSWEGSMTISPASDTWIETQELPTIFNTSTVSAPTETRVVRVRRRVRPTPVRNTSNPPTPPAPSTPPRVTPAPTPTIIVVTPRNIPIPIPLPVPIPLIATIRVQAWARDLGLVNLNNPSDPNWNTRVFVTVPANIGSQVNRVIADWMAEAATGVPFNTSQKWASTITALGTALSNATSVRTASGQAFTTTRVATPAQIINFWQ